jgi:hypothetical protein
MSCTKPAGVTVDDAALEVARRQLGVSYMDLWIDYFALGGSLDIDGLTGYLQGDGCPNPTDHNLIAHALNELFRDRGQDNPIAYQPH